MPITHQKPNDSPPVEEDDTEASHIAKKRLFDNLVSLGLLRGVNFLLPLITLPYLVRVLGAEKFGLVMFAQAFTQYFVDLTNYGFELSATREISWHRDNKERVSEIFNSVMLIKALLMLVSFVLLTIIVFSFDKFEKDWLVYFLTFGLVIGGVAFPVWFFQGIERMQFITRLTLVAKSIFLVSIFVFVTDASDYIYVPLINSLGLIFVGTIALWIAIRKFQINLFIPGYRSALKLFRKSTPFFLSRASVVTYTTSNAFFLGLATNNQIVGYFTAGEKLYLALRLLYDPICSALYPFMSRMRDVQFYKRIFIVLVLANTALCAVCFFFAKEIVILVLGADFLASVAVFKVLLIAVVFVVPSILLGYPYLAALGHARIPITSAMIASAIHIVALVVLASFSLLNIYTLTLMVVATEFLVLCLRIYGVVRKKLWRTS